MSPAYYVQMCFPLALAYNLAWLLFFFSSRTHMLFLYRIDSNKLVFIENGFITLTADKVLGHIVS